MNANETAKIFYTEQTKTTKWHVATKKTRRHKFFTTNWFVILPLANKAADRTSRLLTPAGSLLIQQLSVAISDIF